MNRKFLSNLIVITVILANLIFLSILYLSSTVANSINCLYEGFEFDNRITLKNDVKNTENLFNLYNRIRFLNPLKVKSNESNHWYLSHKLQTIKGLIYLEENNVEVAKECLLNSVNGTNIENKLPFQRPIFTLACELMQLGENEVTLTFFRNMNTLFEHPLSNRNSWIEILENGETPVMSEEECMLDIYHYARKKKEKDE